MLDIFLEQAKNIGHHKVVKESNWRRTAVSSLQVAKVEMVSNQVQDPRSLAAEWTVSSVQFYMVFSLQVTTLDLLLR